MTTLHAVDKAFASGAVVTALHPLGKNDGLAVIRDERPEDSQAREKLLDRALGPGRFGKSSELLRAGRLPADELALVAMVDGVIAGSVRLWHVRAGHCDALLLGPLAVDVQYRSCGLGGALMREAIGRAQLLGHKAVLLVGDAPYYARFGFRADLAVNLDMPGPVDRERFLALEFVPGCLEGANGTLYATGAFSGFLEDVCEAELAA